MSHFLSTNCFALNLSPKVNRRGIRNAKGLTELVSGNHLEKLFIATCVVESCSSLDGDVYGRLMVREGD
jgi:hypothetical protein